MAKSKEPQTRKLPAIVPGSWRGKALGSANVTFGQEAQTGPSRQSVEFTYAVMPVGLTGPDGGFVWPGVLTILAPNLQKPSRTDAGMLLATEGVPALHLTFDVERIQFSDMLPYLSAGRLTQFHFTVEDMQDGHWPVRSWGMGTLQAEPS